MSQTARSTPTESLDVTASLLAAGLQPEQSRHRWTPPDPGTLVGIFPNITILSLIGAGAMGAVYKARQEHLDRVVALKILAPSRALEPNFHERFAREARALARLDHPHIVGLHDYGQCGGFAYLIMSHVEGSNLRQVLSTGVLSATEALRIIPQVCDALVHAHAAGVVHRDLKPENILIDGCGNAHIADFGLAKVYEPGNDLTASGEILGTLHYMAPEQMEAKGEVDHRADLYALGVIIYEMLTGTLPLGRFDPPSHASDVTTALDTVVMKCLERDPRRRYRDATEFRHAMDRASDPSLSAATGTTGLGGDNQSDGTDRLDPGVASGTRPTPPSPPPSSTPPSPPGEPGAPVGENPMPGRGSTVRIDWSGIHVKDADDEVSVGWQGIHVSEGAGSRVHQAGGTVPSRAPDAGPREAERQVHDGLSTLGLLWLSGGSLLGISLAVTSLAAFHHDPLAHLETHRFADLTMLGAPAIVVGGLALLMRTCLAAVVIGFIATLIPLPWAWEGHRVLFYLLAMFVAYEMSRVGNIARLHAHFGSLPWKSRGWRLVLMTPLLIGSLVLPLLPMWRAWHPL